MIIPREKYQKVRELFEKIDKVIEEEKPKNPKLRNKLWEIWAELNEN